MVVGNSDSVVLQTMSGPYERTHLLNSEVDPTSLTEGDTDVNDYSAGIRRRRPKRKVHHIPALSEKFESLDYSIIENKIQKSEEQSVEYSQLVWSRRRNRWIVCCLIGLCTAVIGVLVYTVVDIAVRAKFAFLSQQFAECVENGCVYSVLLFWILINVACVAVAGALCVFVTGPVAAGSGIPQIKCLLNGIKVPGVLRLSTLASKVTGVLGGVVGGLAIGKEGPMIHSGACVAGGISQGRCVTLPFDLNIFEYFRSDKEKRDFVSAGAAAGVAAAFNAPIGGVLFSMEEGASFWSQPLTWRTFFCSMSCYFFLNLLLSAIYTGTGFSTWTGIANFGQVESGTDFAIWEIPLFLLMGVLGGLSGALFNFINKRITIYRMHYVSGKWLKFVEVLVVGAFSAALPFIILFAIDECHPLGTITDISNPVQLWCKDGDYNEMASLIFEAPEKTVKALFHFDTGAFSVVGLIIYLPIYYFMACVTYGIAVPSGLFIPQLLIGALWGRALGIGLSTIMPGQTKFMVPAKYAVIGAAAQIGGVMRMTISLVVILMESIQSLTLGLPLMLVIVVAKWVGDRFNEGIYDMHIDLQEVPVLGWEPPETSSVIPASRVMSRPVHVIRMVEKVSRVLKILKSDQHHGFPVVSDLDPDFEDVYYNPRLDRWEAPTDYGQLEGFISRDQLIVMLHMKAFCLEWARELRVVDVAPRLTLEDFRNPYPRFSDQLQKLNLVSEELEAWMDLKPYMDLAPYTVTEGASLRRIFHLCRQVALRHVVVVSKEHRVLGIVSRKDVARFREERDRQNKRFKIREIYISG